MKIKKCKKESFIVIGKEGSTLYCAGFIQKLWDDANSHFGEIAHLAKKDENGNIIINKEQAEIVRLIFDLYLSGKSILGIIKELQNRGIKSPTGKDRWAKRTIAEMLSNEKYIGVAVINSGGEGGPIYKLNNSHQAIIPKETFDAVQKGKLQRSNLVTDENGTHRSNTKYSSKKK